MNDYIYFESQNVFELSICRKYLLNTYYVPGSVLRHKMMTLTKKKSAPHRAYILVECFQVNCIQKFDLKKTSHVEMTHTALMCKYRFLYLLKLSSNMCTSLTTNKVNCIH